MSASPIQRVVLTGFMGSGKTTVGRLLAARLGWRFVDLDDEITERYGLTVPDIFARFGELHFRQYESLELAVCLRRSGIVLALGGGATEAASNRALLQSSDGTAVVYLSGAFETLQARCLAQSEEPGAVARPVLADADLARRRFATRAPLYLEVATVTLDTTGRPPGALAETLVSTFGIAKHRRETP